MEMYPLPLPPPPLPPAASRANWGGLSEHLLLAVLRSLEPADIAAAHLVAKGWRDAARLATRSLRFQGQAPDTERLRQAFPNVSGLDLARMVLSKQALACVAGLPGLASLALRECQLSEAGAMAALQAASGLQELELSEVLGPSAEELDDAIRGLTNLHRLHVESLSAACKAPSLRSLAFLPRIRHLSVKQARPRHSFVGLTNLGALKDLQALELHGATLTNSIMARLAELTSLTQLRGPDASLVTDHGFEVLSGLTALRELDVSCWRPQVEGPVSNAGAAHLAPLACLNSLSLAGRTPLTACGLGFLEEFTALQHLDLSCVQLDQGSAAFLWQLTSLTCLRLGGTKMSAAQFEGLSSLAKLEELDASGTAFDDACCAQLAGMAALQQLNLSHTHVTTAGVQAVNDAHTGRLRRFEFGGCAVSVSTVLGVLRRQPGGAVLWDPRQRGYLPRWVNTANTLLMVAPPGQRQRLRAAYAPEQRLAGKAGVWALVSGLLLCQGLVLLATLLVLLALPVMGFLGGVALLVLYAAGHRPSPETLLRLAERGEVLLSAVLVGVLCVRVPPRPSPLLMPIA